MNRLRKHDALIVQGLSDHEKIIGFRNVLAHGYDMNDDGITWDVVERKLPVLLSEVRVLLAK